jgi:hypothetical protein
MMGAKAAALEIQARHVAALVRENQILRAQLNFVAELAGVRPELDQIRRHADMNNPASPVPDPPEEPPSETTEETLAPDANGDASRPGAEPGSLTRVPAEQMTTSMTPGVEIQTPPASNLVSVTAPVQGTNPDQDGGVPIEQRRIETDVRVNPNPLAAEGPGIGGMGNDGTAFPWMLDARGEQGTRSQPNENPAARQKTDRTASLQPPASAEDRSGARTMASIRLARLRVHAGLARGDELVLGTQIERDATLSTPAIEHEIGILQQVAAARPPERARPMARQAARSAPSLAPSMAPVYASVSAAGDGDDCSDIFE